MLDTIYEVETVGGNNWWITKETYENLQKLMVNPLSPTIKFNSIHGAEAIVFTKNICALSMTTLANRQKSREMNKEYKTELPAEYEES